MILIITSLRFHYVKRAFHSKYVLSELRRQCDPYTRRNFYINLSHRVNVGQNKQITVASAYTHAYARHSALRPTAPQQRISIGAMRYRPPDSLSFTRHNSPVSILFCLIALACDSCWIDCHHHQTNNVDIQVSILDSCSAVTKYTHV